MLQFKKIFPWERQEDGISLRWHKACVKIWGERRLHRNASYLLTFARYWLGLRPSVRLHRDSLRPRLFTRAHRSTFTFCSHNALLQLVTRKKSGTLGTSLLRLVSERRDSTKGCAADTRSQPIKFPSIMQEALNMAIWPSYSEEPVTIITVESME